MKKILTALLLTLPLMLSAQDTVVLTKDNVINLNAPFYTDTVAKLVAQAREMDKSESKDPIYLVLNSPGGYIDAGLEMIENLSKFSRPVKTVTLFAASMGFQTVQGLGERLITKDGTLMSHKARGGFYGEFPGQLDSRYAHSLKRVTRMNEQAVSRTGGKHTLESYNSLIENEYWCDGKDCIEQGFADRVVSLTCDKSLSGTSWVTEDRFFFYGSVIEFVMKLENCPLNTGYLDYNILIDGEPLFKTEEMKNSYWESPIKGLSAEKVFELKLKVDQVLQSNKARRVIYGY
jgi:ATP-dependent Clp protease protease subunit